MKTNVVYNKSCLNMEEIDDNSIDLVITDPPYGINYKDWDRIENFLEFTESWVKECFRVLKDSGSFYSFMSWVNVAEFKLLLDKYGKIRNWIVWERTKGRANRTNFKSTKEELLYYIKNVDCFTWNNQEKLLREVLPFRDKNGKPKGWFYDEGGNRCRWSGIGNVWHYVLPPIRRKGSYFHTAQKPLKLMERIILSSSNENNVILDPFIGSGTTAIACKRLNREYIGYEIEKKYCEIVEKRLVEEDTLFNRKKNANLN